jgi:hypothetical protein
MSRSFHLDDLLASMRADRQRMSHPGREPLWAALSDRSAREVERTVRQLERSHQATYALYGSLDELRIAVADALDHEQPQIRSMEDLVRALEYAADQEWLVASPLVNVMPPDGVERIGGTAALAPTSANDAHDHHLIESELRKIFGTPVDVGWRRHHDADDNLVDCRHTASLVTAQRGPRHACEHRALTGAQLLLAVWTLLSPPHGDTFMPLWPIATEWLPQPHLHITQRAARISPPDKRSRSQGSTVLYTPDEAALYRPPSAPAREAPMRALEEAATHRPASALLSAAWSLYLAARLPTDLQWLDRLVWMMRARDALCEPPPGLPGGAIDRWRALSHRLGLPDQLRDRGFDAKDIASVTDRAWELRNLGVHSGDLALLALGFPPERSRPVRRGTPITGSELAPLYIREGSEPTFAAVHISAVALWEQMLEHDFDEEHWERLLATS